MLLNMHPLIYSLNEIKRKAEIRNLPTENIKAFLKEELQTYVLDFIYNSKDYKELIFYGGTSLRKLFQLNRLSEDLDFESTYKSFDLNQMSKDLESYFKNKVQYKDISLSVQQSNYVNRITLKFPILYELGLSKLVDEKLHIKVEVNTKITGLYPTLFTPFTSAQFSMLIKHYDLPTLMAGKMLAALDRAYKKGNTGIEIKGRDYYDLIWYMQKKIIPNGNKILDTNENYSFTKLWNLLDENINKIKFNDLFIDLHTLFDNQDFINDWCSNFHHIYFNLKKEYFTFFNTTKNTKINMEIKETRTLKKGGDFHKVNFLLQNREEGINKSLIIRFPSLLLAKWELDDNVEQEQLETLADLKARELVLSNNLATEFIFHDDLSNSYPTVEETIQKVKRQVNWLEDF